MKQMEDMRSCATDSLSAPFHGTFLSPALPIGTNPALDQLCMRQFVEMLR